MLSVLEIIKKTTDFFEARGIEHARFNAEHLIGHALGLKRMQLYLQFERLLKEQELEKIRPLVRRRAAREPLAYVLGETDFHGLRIKCDRRALIPRPETEELVALGLGKLGSSVTAPLLDLGTGTGCIALSLAKTFASAPVYAVDKSAEALSLASENAEGNGLTGRVTFLESDWYSAVPAELRFAAIFSNPPYLTQRECEETLPEVRSFEPHSALVADKEGLSDLENIVAGAASRLQDGGFLFLETGIAQHPALLEQLKAAGFSEFASHQDLSGRDRFLSAKKA